VRLRKRWLSIPLAALATTACSALIGVREIYFEDDGGGGGDATVDGERDAFVTSDAPADVRVDGPPPCIVRGFFGLGLFCDDFDDPSGSIGAHWGGGRFSDASIIDLVPAPSSAVSPPRTLRTALEARGTPGGAYVELSTIAGELDCAATIAPRVDHPGGLWVFEIELPADGGAYRVLVYAGPNGYKAEEVFVDGGFGPLGTGSAGAVDGFSTFRIVTRPDGGRTELYRDGLLRLVGQIAPVGERAIVRLGTLSPYAGGDDGGVVLVDDVRCTFR
jgi:hypothetical protein